MAVQKSKKNKVTIHDKIGTRSLDIKAMEKWLWDAACSIRGHSDAPKFKDFILPLVFFKRLSDVFDDEIQQKIEEFGDKEIALEIIEADHLDALKNGRRGIVRFFIPQGYNWQALRSPKSSPHFEGKSSLGEFVTDAMREVGRLNPELKDVLTKDFNETQSGQRAIDDERLGNLIESLSKYRLGLDDCEPDFLGRAYEYLLRKFAEGQGQSAGEFYTPKEVGWLMAKLLDPQPRTTVYDPTCGSGGLLIKARMVYEEHHPKEKAKAPRLFGQESTAATFAIAKMNMFLHDYAESHVAIGDTLKNPKFSAEGAGLTQFDYVVANPMWNQTGYDETFYQSDKWNRFAYGIPSDKADWGWLQHMLASLKSTGKAAVVLDTGAVSRGSGSKNRDKEREIRKAFVDNDLIEGVVLLPENLFYNTTAPGIIVLLNRKKEKERKGKIILINATQLFYKDKPKNVLSDDGVATICKAYAEWKNIPKVSRIVSTEDVRAQGYNLSPSQFVDIGIILDYRNHSDIAKEINANDSELERLKAKFARLSQNLGAGKTSAKDKAATVKLGSVIETAHSGGTPSSDQADYWNGDIGWTTTSPISEDDLYLTKAQRYISEKGVENSSTKIVPANNVLVGTRVGVGKAVVNKIDVAINQDLTALIPNKSKILPEFLAYQLKLQRIQNYFTAHKGGTTIKGITRHSLLEIPIHTFPLEQQSAVIEILRLLQEINSLERRQVELRDELFHTLLDKLMTGEITAGTVAKKRAV